MSGITGERSRDSRAGVNHPLRNVYPRDVPRVGSQGPPPDTYPLDVRDRDVVVDLP